MLALDPQNAQAKGRVERIRRRERLLKYGRRALLIGAALAALWGVGWEIRYAVLRARARAAAERAERDRQAAKQAPAPLQPPATATPKPPPAPPPKKVAPPPAPPPKVATVEPLQVKLHAQLGAQVTVDGRDLGNNNMFALQLTPGVHRVVVHHPCCADAAQELVVSPNRPDQIYPLQYGPAQPARFKVTNAPPDARVLVDGVLVGTAADPRPWSMTKPFQKVTVTIGDRTLSATLKAGMLNLLDYAQGTP